jgi:peptidoglycan/LPS O-acetylase OafA/YrhL
MKLIDREWTSKAPKLSHVAPFDGIRGFGILGVMIGHSFPLDTLSWAGIVDIFFVISGFLITTLLLQEHRGYGAIDLRKFYARRTLRLFPLLYVALFTIFVAGVISKQAGWLEGTPYTLRELTKETAASAFYVHNIFFPTLGGAWLAHLWTLSVEEQFYLIVGVLMVVALVRGGIRVMMWLLVAAIAAIQLSRGFGITGPVPELAFAVWLQRPDSLMIGMLAALINAHLPDPLSERTRRLMRIGGWIGVIGLFSAVWASTSFARNQLGIHIPFYPGDPNYLPDGATTEDVIRPLFDAGGWRLRLDRTYWLQWGFTVVNWSILLICMPVFRVKEWWPNKLMSVKPLVRIGALLSYGLYIWHYPVQHFIRIAVGTTEEKNCVVDGVREIYVQGCRAGDHYRTLLHPVVQLILDVGLPFLVAIPTYLFVERKALEIKNRFQVDKAALADAEAAKSV